MILDKKRHSIQTWGMVGISALASVLVAAVSHTDVNWARIRELPPVQRAQLLQNLRKFDLELTPDKQATIRELDRRIIELQPAEQARYFWVLRRYHDWLNRLPENRQGELLGQSPDERMVTIRKLVSDHPLPSSGTPPFLQIAEVGEFSPFELASAFRIWQVLTAEQRKAVEHKAQESGRREKLFELGRELEKPIPRETRPPDYDQEKWIGLLEKQGMLTRQAVLAEELAKKSQDEEARTKLENRRKDVHYRQAINYYVSKTQVRSVQPERLSHFVAALPPWIQSGMEHYPPDEARRRVSFAYRLVFPHPQEIGEVLPSSAPPTKGSGGSISTSKKSGVAPAQRKGMPRPRPDSPF